MKTDSFIHANVSSANQDPASLGRSRLGVCYITVIFFSRDLFLHFTPRPASIRYQAVHMNLTFVICVYLMMNEAVCVTNVICAT